MSLHELPVLNIFYQEPDPDRWFKYDRYPRKFIRRLLRGRLRPGGVAMVAINLMKGLDKLGIPYRYNDFKYIRKHPDEIACIIGKPHLLFDKYWKNPVIFGAGVYSHPEVCPDLFFKYPNVKRILVPGDWIKAMFEPYYPTKVISWPVGIDTEKWSATIKKETQIDFLIYDKVRWEQPHLPGKLDDTICGILEKRSLSYSLIRYGHYEPQELMEKLGSVKAVIFLCEHETQGLAYQQILSTGTPILAWDQGEYWKDPAFYPQIKYGPVSSVPYWDDRCGMKFLNTADFETELTVFWEKLDSFKPRAYVLEHLTLEKCAQNYLDIYGTVLSELEHE